MGSFVVFFFDGRDEITSLFFTIDTLYMTDKSGFFDFFLDLTVLFNCSKFHDLYCTKKTPKALDFYE